MGYDISLMSWDQCIITKREKGKNKKIFFLKKEKTENLKV